MRKIITDDLFSFARVLSTANVKTAFEDLLNEGKNAKNEKGFSAERFGIHAFVVVLDACGRDGVKDAFYDFLAGPFETSSEAVKNMPVDELVKNFKALFEMNNMTAFFDMVGKLM